MHDEIRDDVIYAFARNDVERFHGDVWRLMVGFGFDWYRRRNVTNALRSETIAKITGWI